MSTAKNRKHPADVSTAPSQPQGVPFHALAELLLLMATVETTSAEAKLNESSMDDNNGGRIWF